MKINWKSVVFAAICSYLLLLILGFLPAFLPVFLIAIKVSPTQMLTLDAILAPILLRLGMFVSFFLGALWVARKIESGFILHGVLVAVLVAIIARIVTSLALPLLLRHLHQSHGVSSTVQPYKIFPIVLFELLRIIAAAVGAYIGGKWRAKPQAEQLGALLR